MRCHSVSFSRTHWDDCPDERRGRRVGSPSKRALRVGTVQRVQNRSQMRRQFHFLLRRRGLDWVEDRTQVGCASYNLLDRCDLTSSRTEQTFPPFPLLVLVKQSTRDCDFTYL